MARRKKQNRAGFIFMLVIVILLGVIIFAYKERFIVLLNTAYNSGKESLTKYFPKKENEKSILDKINLLENKNELKNENAADKDKSLVSEPEKEKTKNIKKDEKVKKDPVVKEPVKIVTEIQPVTKITEQNQEKIENQKNKIKKETVPVKNNQAKEKVKILKETDSNLRTSKLYFTRLDKNENLSLAAVSRKVTYTDSPLTETLKELLNGPKVNEKTSEIITNIPLSTKLISITIKDKIVFLNFSREFEFNQYGKESTINQLKQIVFTVTEFANIKSVQFLIDGKIKTYLGGEGVIINKPLGRNDFS